MKKSKAILLALCAVLLVAASVMGTLAYLTSTDSVTNTFTVGNVQIKLDEAKANADGSLVANADRVQANEYHLLPGHSYTKDPTVWVDEKSEDCYLFVKVENGIAGIEDSANTIASQMAAKGWAPIAEGSNVYAYIGTAEGASVATPVAVHGGENKVVFESFKISGSVSNDVLTGTPDYTTDDGETVAGTDGYDDAQIVVTAYAIQADGFAGKTASEIWTAASFT